MFRITSFRLAAFFTALALCLFLPSPAGAKKVETGYFSVDLPSGWTFQEEGDLVTLSSPGGGPALLIYLEAVEELKLEQMAKERAGKQPVKKLGAGYAYENDKGARCWVTGSEYAFLVLTANAPSEVAAKIIASLRASEHAPYDAAKALKAAGKPDVLNWLQSR